MSNFHLRPVSETSPSPSPTAPNTPSDERGLPFNRVPSTSAVVPSPGTSASAMPRSRRPLSPSSLRDVDLSHDADMQHRKYPAPPLNGHDLMALFPPAPPANFPEMRPGPTSGYFQRQERAFFAQAGKEIVRVRVEVDVPPEAEAEGSHGKARARDAGPRSWSQPGHVQLPPHPQHHSPQSTPASSSSYPPQSSRSTRAAPNTGTPTSQYATVPSSQSQPPPNLHPPTVQRPGVGMRTPPHDPSNSDGSATKVEFQAEELRDDPDESWRRPIPYAERRRAGKHTRRVIVRN